MSIDSRITEQIKFRLKEFISNPENLKYYYNKVATEFGVLPLYVDWEECRAIRPNGEIVSYFHDNSFSPNAEVGKLRIETDLRWKNIALVQGSKKYPELKDLIPEKPFNAKECPYCKGTGLEELASNPDYK